MTRIILTGCCGKMGHVIQSIVSSRNDCEIVAGVDVYDSKDCDFPIYSSISEVEQEADALIDFSNPSPNTSTAFFAREARRFTPIL